MLLQLSRRWATHPWPMPSCKGFSPWQAAPKVFISVWVILLRRNGHPEGEGVAGGGVR
jgi:hypothetical protein